MVVLHSWSKKFAVELENSVLLLVGGSQRKNKAESLESLLSPLSFVYSSRERELGGISSLLMVWRRLLDKFMWITNEPVKTYFCQCLFHMMKRDEFTRLYDLWREHANAKARSSSELLDNSVLKLLSEYHKLLSRTLCVVSTTSSWLGDGEAQRNMSSLVVVMSLFRLPNLRPHLEAVLLKHGRSALQHTSNSHVRAREEKPLGATLDRVISGPVVCGPKCERGKHHSEFLSLLVWEDVTTGEGKQDPRRKTNPSLDRNRTDSTPEMVEGPFHVVDAELVSRWLESQLACPAWTLTLTRTLAGMVRVVWAGLGYGELRPSDRLYPEDSRVIRWDLVPGYRSVMMLFMPLLLHIHHWTCVHHASDLRSTGEYLAGGRCVWYRGPHLTNSGPHEGAGGGGAGGGGG